MGPLHLRFGKFQVPPPPLCNSSVGGKQGVFLSSPGLSYPEWSKDQSGEAFLRTYTHTFPPTKPWPLAASGGRMTGKGRQSRCPRVCVGQGGCV